jgi:DNA primase
LALGCGDPIRASCCVLVEDALSAITVGRQYYAVALMGTHLTDHVLQHITEYHDKFVVWLDMDNPEVISNAKKIRKRLTLFGQCGMIEYTGKDPKDCSDEEIRDLIEVAKS